MVTTVGADTPSSDVLDLIANLTEEGLELVRRLSAFAEDYGTAKAAFDLEVEGLDWDDERYREIQVTSGRLVLDAMVEQMSTALCVVLGITDDDVADLATAT